MRSIGMPERLAQVGSVFVGVVGALVLFAAEAGAQGPPIPLTAELQVNQFSTGSQSGAVIGMRDDGVHVVVWESAGQDGDGNTIVQRKFPADGSAPFNESVLDQSTAGDQLGPSIGMNATGDWLAVWDSTATNAGIRGRASGNGGTTLGPEFQASATNQAAAQIARASRADDGSYVATFDHGGAFLRAFDTAGNATTADQEVGPTLTGTARPAPGSGPGGTFVIAFVADDGDQKGAFAQRFDADAFPLGTPITVPESNAGTDFSPVIGVAADGSFAIAWLNSTTGTRVRCFSAAGVARGGEIPVNGSVIGVPSIGISPEGQFVVTFTPSEVQAQELDRTCHPVGTGFVVNTVTAGGQTGITAAAGRDRYGFAWTTNGVDGDGSSIARRLFRFRSIYSDDFESDDLVSWSVVVP